MKLIAPFILFIFGFTFYACATESTLSTVNDVVSLQGTNNNAGLDSHILLTMAVSNNTTATYTKENTRNTYLYKETDKKQTSKIGKKDNLLRCHNNSNLIVSSNNNLKEYYSTSATNSPRNNRKTVLDKSKKRFTAIDNNTFNNSHKLSTVYTIKGYLINSCNIPLDKNLAVTLNTSITRIKQKAN